MRGDGSAISERATGIFDKGRDELALEVTVMQ